MTPLAVATGGYLAAPLSIVTSGYLGGEYVAPTTRFRSRGLLVNVGRLMNP